MRAPEIAKMLRDVYARKVEGPNAEKVRLHGTLLVGFGMLDDKATEKKILAIAQGAATLRQVDDVITYHDVRCTVCAGKGGDCATCGGDGFSPPCPK